jgi:hypothetical protein
MADIAPVAPVAEAKGPNYWLIVLGVALIALAGLGVWFSHAYGSQTRETNVKSATSAKSGTPAEPSTETKTTDTRGVPSDSLLTATLGTGAGLIALGALYARITTIKLPGPVEIGLTDSERAEVKKEAGDAASKKSMTTQQTVDLTARSLRAAIETKTATRRAVLASNDLKALVESQAEDVKPA